MNSISRTLTLLNFLLLIFISQSFAQKYKIIESNIDHITIEFDFVGSYSIEDMIVNGKKFQKIRGNENYYREPGDPWIPLIDYNIGVPHNSNPSYRKKPM